MKDANEYQEKLELGKIIYKMMGEVEVPYQSLKRDKKEALDTYIQHQEDFRDVRNVELKPSSPSEWQKALDSYLKTRSSN